VAEVVRLTLDFYSRNYIEGLFLSSGIIRDPDYTMEQLVAVVRSLREEHDFRGYIHLKTIADADPRLITLAGAYADRVSVNAELPLERSLARLAPEKSVGSIKRSMARLREGIDEALDDERAPRFAPGGQSTQIIVGADDATDRGIIENSAALYGSYQLRRVYYSAFSPIPDSSKLLPSQPAALVREHRLYQADWLMRYYGFAAPEIFDHTQDGMLELDVDPKLSWALAHRDRFPVDVNRCSREELLRVPGLGATAVKRILAARAIRKVRVEDLRRLRVPLRRALPFLKLPDAEPHTPLDAERLPHELRRASAQLRLFG
jgi:putative DNA modification/repair radical SAM protein